MFSWDWKVRNDTRDGIVSDGVKITVNVDNPTTVKLNLKELKASTLYRVELRAYNEIGYSLPAEILVRTAKSESLHSASLHYNKKEKTILHFSISYDLIGDESHSQLNQAENERAKLAPRGGSRLLCGRGQ